MLPTGGLTTKGLFSGVQGIHRIRDAVPVDLGTAVCTTAAGSPAPTGPKGPRHRPSLSVACMCRVRGRGVFDMGPCCFSPAASPACPSSSVSSPSSSFSLCSPASACLLGQIPCTTSIPSNSCIRMRHAAMSCPASPFVGVCALRTRSSRSWGHGSGEQTRDRPPLKPKPILNNRRYGTRVATRLLPRHS